MSEIVRITFISGFWGNSCDKETNLNLLLTINEFLLYQNVKLSVLEKSSYTKEANLGTAL